MKANILKNISYALVLLLTFSSCSKDDDRIEAPNVETINLSQGTEDAQAYSIKIK